ncbi:MAG: DNA-binding response regulator [Acidobacteria bacterium]|nr:MAG: DNA-binding response regulator [Acidobacteriota bacterium]
MPTSTIPFPSAPPGKLSGAQTIRIAIADDHTLFREGLRTLLEQQPDFEVVGTTDVNAILRLVEKARPDVLLLDFRMPHPTGFETLRALHDANSVRTILLTGAIDKSQIIEALQLGVRGVVLKSSASDLLFKGMWIGRETVTDVITLLCRPLEESFVPPAKDFGLSPREREIVAAIVAGYTNGEIAKSLKIGEQTVKHHLTNIFRKTEVSNRLELALFAINRRLVREDA